MPPHASTFFRIDWQLAPVKVAFFALYGGVACFYWYLPMFLRSLNLSSAEIGVIAGSMPFIGGVSRPLVGALADKLRRHKLILIIWSAFSGILFFMVLIPPVPQPPVQMPFSLEVTCRQDQPLVELCGTRHCQLETLLNESRQHSSIADEYIECEQCNNSRCEPVTLKPPHLLPFSAQNLQDNCYVSPFTITATTTNSTFSPNLCLNLSTNTNCWLSRPDTLHNLSSTCEPIAAAPEQFGTSFIYLFVLSLFGVAVFSTPMYGLLDACTYMILGEDRLLYWGIHRGIGSLGCAVMGFSVGFVMDMIREPSEEVNYFITFGGFLGAQVVFVIAVFFFKMDRGPRCENMGNDLGKLLQNGRVWLVMFLVIIFGMHFGTIEGYLFIYVKSKGGTTTLVGLAIVVTSVPEVIMLFLSKPIIRRIGEIPCLYLSCVAYVVRFLLYSVLENPYMFLIPECLHGFTFALMYAAVCLYAARISPPGTQATVQNIFRAIHFSFARGAGLLIGGALYDAIGGRRLWLIHAGLAAATLLIFIILQQIIQRRERSAAAADGQNEDITFGSKSQNIQSIMNGFHDDQDGHTKTDGSHDDDTKMNGLHNGDGTRESFITTSPQSIESARSPWKYPTPMKTRYRDDVPVTAL